MGDPEIDIQLVRQARQYCVLFVVVWLGVDIAVFGVSGEWFWCLVFAVTGATAAYRFGWISVAATSDGLLRVRNEVRNLTLPISDIAEFRVRSNKVGLGSPIESIVAVAFDGSEHQLAATRGWSLDRRRDERRAGQLDQLNSWLNQRH